MSDELRACLEGFRQHGHLDSSGEFTLSRDHAQKKLQEFTLPDPRLYVLNLVASAVCGGGRRVEFRADSDELWMLTDATLEDVRELEAMENVLFSNRVGSALRELVIGMSGLLALKPKKVELEVSDAKARYRVHWDGQRYQCEELDKDQSHPLIKLYVQERPGFRVARKLAANIGGGMLPDSEEDAVFRYCNRCPIRVDFNGKVANRPVILGTCRHATFSNSPFPQGHMLAELGSPHPAPAGVSGLLAIGGRLAPWVTLVYQGVNFRLPENAFATRDLRGIIYCDNLRKDLSQVQLVQDEGFNNLMRDIQALARQHLS